MAINSLFFQNVNALKATLRLSGTANSDGLAIIDAAIQQTRVGFYDTLGALRISQLLALTLTENPTDIDGILRLKASLCESSWVRMLLLRKMPLLFIDGSSKTREIWNEEALTREAQKDIDSEIARLATEIQDFLTDLASGTAEESILNISSIGPDRKPPRVGQSAFLGPYTKSIFPIQWFDDRYIQSIQWLG